MMAAGSSGVYSTVREGIVAGGRPVGSDGLQTFGGVRALARYVKIEVVPSSGESIIINEASRKRDAASGDIIYKKQHLLKIVSFCLVMMRCTYQNFETAPSCFRTCASKGVASSGQTRSN